MKIIFILLTISSALLSENIYFHQNSLNTTEIEAKIVSKIACDFISEPKIYITGNNNDLEKFISKEITVLKSCSEANFIYIKKDTEFDILECQNKNPIFFTNDKYYYINNEFILGAFFWLKSRPNVRVSTKRANKLGIQIPDSYLRFMDTKQ